MKIAEEILSPSIQEVERIFTSGSLESAVCAYVFLRLKEIGPAAAHYDLGSVALALKLTEPHQAKAIISALDFLSFCRNPVLSRRFALWDANSADVLEQPICILSDRDVRAAIEANELINPLTGESVPDFSDRITVEYHLADTLRTILQKKGPTL